MRTIGKIVSVTFIACFLILTISVTNFSPFDIMQSLLLHFNDRVVNNDLFDGTNLPKTRPTPAVTPTATQSKAGFFSPVLATTPRKQTVVLTGAETLKQESGTNAVSDTLSENFQTVPARKVDQTTGNPDPATQFTKKETPKEQPGDSDNVRLSPSDLAQTVDEIQDEELKDLGSVINELMEVDFDVNNTSSSTTEEFTEIVETLSHANTQMNEETSASLDRNLTDSGEAKYSKAASRELSGNVTSQLPQDAGLNITRVEYMTPGNPVTDKPAETDAETLSTTALSSPSAEEFRDIINSTHICSVDVVSHNLICRLKCPPEHFSLPGMVKCSKWLMCDDLDEIVIEHEFCKRNSTLQCREHYVKQLFRAKWEGHPIVLAKLTAGWQGMDKSWDDFAEVLFDSGHAHLSSLQGNHSFVMQFVGGCKKSWIATQFYEKGGLADVESFLQANLFLDNLTTRFHLCLSYARILKFLRHSPIGRVVMADADTPKRTMSQFVITRNLNIMLADVDMLPLAKNGTICRHRRLRPFIAPEQECVDGTNSIHGSSDTAKIDIWKFPSICRQMLNKSHRSHEQLHDGLMDIFGSCLQEEPSLRPNADEVLEQLETLSLMVFGTVY